MLSKKKKSPFSEMEAPLELLRRRWFSLPLNYESAPIEGTKSTAFDTCHIIIAQQSPFFNVEAYCFALFLRSFIRIESVDKLGAVVSVGYDDEEIATRFVAGRLEESHLAKVEFKDPAVRNQYMSLIRQREYQLIDGRCDHIAGLVKLFNVSPARRLTIDRTLKRIDNGQNMHLSAWLYETSNPDFNSVLDGAEQHLLGGRMEFSPASRNLTAWRKRLFVDILCTMSSAACLSALISTLLGLPPPLFSGAERAMMYLQLNRLARSSI